MNRRTFLEALCAATLGWRNKASAQPAKTRRVAVLAPGTQAAEAAILKPFFDGMREFGWVEGRNVLYDWALAGNDHARLPALAAELVKRNPDVIFAPPTPAAVAASRATRTIPVVFSVNVDPVALGLVKSLARPAANVTGVTYVFESLAPKRIEVFKGFMPKAQRIGVLFDPSDPGAQADLRALEQAKPKLGVTLFTAAVQSPQALDAGIGELLAQTPDVVLITGTMLYNLRLRVLELAMSKRTPVTGATVQLAEDGALFAYGLSLAERIRRGAYYVDRILKGANPGDLPVEQISRVEFVINLQVARALGISIPQSVLLRADRVIE
jgi:putative ABC transport system substrate-binding protein